MKKIAQGIAGKLKQSKRKLWRRFVGDIQNPHSIEFNYIENIVDDLIEENIKKLSIEDLAKLFDRSTFDQDTGNVYNIIDEFANDDSKIKIAKLLSDLECELRDYIKKGIRGQIFRIAVDTDSKDLF